MANFKIGQRVKRAREFDFNIPIGSTGTVASGPRNGCGDVVVAWDDPILAREYANNGVSASTLEPLTDPKADAFIEGLRKLGREPQPDVLTELETAIEKAFAPLLCPNRPE